MAKHPNYDEIDKHPDKPIAVVVGCSYTDDKWWNIKKRNSYNGIVSPGLAQADPQGPWPMWGELFYKKLDPDLLVLNIASSGAGLDLMMKRLIKTVSDYQDRIKFVLLGGSGLERWDWPNDHSDLQWKEVDSTDGYKPKLNQEFWAFNSLVKNSRFDKLHLFDSMNTLEARDRFIERRKVVCGHYKKSFSYNSEDPALWNNPEIVEIILASSKISWKDHNKGVKQDWFSSQYYKGALHHQHSLLVSRQHFQAKHKYVIEYLQKILLLINYFKGLKIPFLYYQLMPLFELIEDSDKHTQPNLPFCLNRDMTSDEIFIQSEIYNKVKENKKHIVNFDPYMFFNYDRWQALEHRNNNVKVCNSEGVVIDGHPSGLGQELIFKHAWDWYEKHW